MRRFFLRVKVLLWELYWINTSWNHGSERDLRIIKRWRQAYYKVYPPEGFGFVRGLDGDPLEYKRKNKNK